MFSHAKQKDPLLRQKRRTKLGLACSYLSWLEYIIIIISLLLWRSMLRFDWLNILFRKNHCKQFILQVWQFLEARLRIRSQQPCVSVCRCELVWRKVGLSQQTERSKKDQGEKFIQFPLLEQCWSRLGSWEMKVNIDFSYISALFIVAAPQTWWGAFSLPENLAVGSLGLNYIIVKSHRRIPASNPSYCAL